MILYYVYSVVLTTPYKNILVSLILHRKTEFVEYSIASGMYRSPLIPIRYSKVWLSADSCQGLRLFIMIH